jgi:hypothetical protein
MLSRPVVLRSLLVGLLVGSAALFAVGVAIERSQPPHSAARERAEHTAQAAAATGAEGTAAEASHHGATAERGKSPGEGAGPEPGMGEAARGSAPRTETPKGTAGETGGERVFGLNPDATGLVLAAVLSSLALAIAVWRYPRSRVVLGVVTLAALFFCAFDVREAVHQAGESRPGLVAVASIVAALHLATAGVAIALWRVASEGPTAPIAPSPASP